MNILKAIRDPNLFFPFFGEDLTSWGNWMLALRALYGLGVRSAKDSEFLQERTGRNASELPKDGFTTALFLTGRRSGKSRIAATVAAFESLFAGHEEKLAPGERGILPVISPTRAQSAIVWGYLDGLFNSSELLRKEVVERLDGANERALVLRNGLRIQILTGDPRVVRGFTLIGAVIDEVSFFHHTDECKVTASELVRALRPGLATTGGRMVCISSKYARQGWAYQTWLKQHGSNKESPSFTPKWHSLVWDADSRTMNPLLPQEVIDAAYIEDSASARSEFGGQWRDDVSEFVPRSLVESLVTKGRKELLPRPGRYDYVAFVDISGGRRDDSSLAIGHIEDRKVVLDFARIWKSPHNPHSVIREMASEVKRFGLRRVVGDNYSAEFVAEAFKANGIAYTKADKPKAELYREILPRLCSGEIELLDDPKLIDQLAGLERRTRSGGKDVIDHAPGAKDDLANAVAGVAATLGKPRVVIGAIPIGMKRPANRWERLLEQMTE